jgi:TRAP-type C4-dicarboxylate transport system permease small subunit
MGIGERSLPAWAARTSARLNWLIERVCALLAAVLVLDVWLGVLVRFDIVPLQLTFTEEAARYLMIWTALLAVSCGIARREHIGVLIVFERLPPILRRIVLAGLDLLALSFFLYLLYFGIGFAASGLSRFTMIYGMNKALPFAAVPASAALAAIQLVLVGIRDQARQTSEATEDRS